MVGTALACATTQPSLILHIGRGDDVTKVVERHADEIRAYLAEAGQFAGYEADGLAHHLLLQHSPLLLLETNPGNRIVIHRDGRLTIVPGRGAVPRAPQSSERLKATMEDLFHEASEDVHEKALTMATQEGVAMEAFSVGDEGQTVTVGGRRYAAGQGVQFIGRKGHFHVLGNNKTMQFNVPVWPVAGARFSFPRNPYFYLSPDDRVEMKSDTEATVAWLISEGQLLATEDHYFLTRSFDFEPWQALRRYAEAEDAPTMRRELAKQVEVALLGEALQIDPADPARSLADLKLRLSRIWKAIEADMSGPELTFVVAYNAEIAANGKLLHLGRQLLSAAEGLRFTLCKHHVHVVGIPRLGLDVALSPPARGQPLRIPSHAFLTLQGGRVGLRPMSHNLIGMLEKRQIAPVEHGYRITEQYYPDAFEQLRAALEDGSINAGLRSDIRRVLDESLQQELPLDSERKLMAALGGLWRRLHRARARLPARP